MSARKGGWPIGAVNLFFRALLMFFLLRTIQGRAKPPIQVHAALQEALCLFFYIELGAIK